MKCAGMRLVSDELKIGAGGHLYFFVHPSSTGYGFIKDYPAEKFYRDVKLCTIGEGTSEIQRMVIGREVLKR